MKYILLQAIKLLGHWRLLWPKSLILMAKVCYHIHLFLCCPKCDRTTFLATPITRRLTQEQSNRSTSGPLQISFLVSHEADYQRQLDDLVLRANTDARHLGPPNTIDEDVTEELWKQLLRRTKGFVELVDKASKVCCLHRRLDINSDISAIEGAPIRKHGLVRAVCRI